MKVTNQTSTVFQEHTKGSNAEYQTLIDLPVDIQVATNTLEVVATTTAPKDGGARLDNRQLRIDSWMDRASRRPPS